MKGEYSMCDHERLRTVGDRVFCCVCGKELPLDFLMNQGKPAEPPAQEKEPETEPEPEKDPEPAEPAADDKKPAENQADGKKPGKSPGRKPRAKNAE